MTTSEVNGMVLDNVCRKKSERKLRNKTKHAKTGNKTSALKVDSWNSGHAQLVKQMNEVKALIQDRRPHVFVIEEANFWAWQKKEEDYKVHTTKMLENPLRQCSRASGLC